jgi:hypothetical protein
MVRDRLNDPVSSIAQYLLPYQFSHISNNSSAIISTLYISTHLYTSRKAIAVLFPSGRACTPFLPISPASGNFPHTPIASFFANSLPF